MVSIIIPVHNAQANLETCLGSVLSQTYDSWECILIDDGSVDESPVICDKFAAADKRFKVIHQKNAGVSSARNRGLDYARGDYVAFVDSDDSVSPGYLEALVEMIVEPETDLVVCGMNVHGVDGSNSVCLPLKEGSFSLDDVDTDQFLELEKANLLFGPCAKIYRRDLIDKGIIRYDEAKDYGEDLEFNLKYLSQVRRIFVVHESLYTYNRGVGTLSTRFRPDMFSRDYGLIKSLITFHEKKGLLSKTTKEFLYGRLWGIVYDGLFLFPRLKDASYDYLKEILSIPEIDSFGEYQESFNCASWIKKWILGRRAFLFYLYFRLFHK